MESIKNRLTSSSAAGDLSIVVPVALTILRTIKVVMGFAATSRGRLGYAVGATAVAPILICTSVRNSSLLDPAARRAAADKLKELYATAQLEEKQNNKPHATQLYRQIVEEYPSSTYANQAKTSLAELEKAR